MTEPLQRLIVPTDFSELSQVAARTAVPLAKPGNASIHLLHVIRLPILHTTYDANIPEATWEGLRAGAREEMEKAAGALEQEGVATVGRILSESLQPAEAIVRSRPILSGTDDLDELTRSCRLRSDDLDRLAYAGALAGFEIEP